MTMDLFTSRGPRSSERANEIKAQVAAQLGLTEDATIMVTELTCFEEGCPPMETVIAVFQPGTEKLQFKLHCSIAEITAHDIREMCAKQIQTSIHTSREKNHGSCCS